MDSFTQEDLMNQLTASIKNLGDKNMFSYILMAVVMICMTILRATSMILQKKYNNNRLKIEEEKIKSESN